MRRHIHIGAAVFVFLFCSVAIAAAQPSSEEEVNILAETFDQTNQVDLQVFTVPAGKQLIIEYVSLRARVPAGETVNSALLNLPHVHFFVVAAQGTIGNQSFFTAAQNTRIVIGAGQRVVFRAERSNHGTTALVSATIAGRLVTVK